MTNILYYITLTFLVSLTLIVYYVLLRLVFGEVAVFTTVVISLPIMWNKYINRRYR